ncbi:hypothetical protein K2173_002002 [Erythroxylum novogranatense]|uniref:DUF4378 domain-containing protein n=1 Tax=Erythroxylum novogranatense TaxID=1862640 RepID=A0AAV8SQ67_9ROSI|nr:hypothetical protein K2173_002002 [Erythroxylum novogranatense]
MSLMASFRSSSPDRIRSRRLGEGTGRVQKKNLPKLASDSCSQSTDTTEEDLVAGELGWRSSKQAFGTPMKKLLAKEMSRDSESKRRSPNVIARLMGLDGLPPLQPSLRQQKMSSGSLQKVASTKKYEKNSTSHSSRSSRKSSMENQEFKDVFEVLDAAKLQSNNGSSSSRFSPQDTVNPKINEAEMAFIQHKFKVAKQLSTSEKHHNSKEFHDAIDDLDSNKDLLLKFLDQPDALFTKHLHDLQSSPPNCHFGQISTVRSSYHQACQTSDRRCKIERESSRKNLTNSDDDFVSHSRRKLDAHNLQKSSNVEVENKDGSGGFATRIVLLKPNLGKGQSTARTVSSTFSSHEFPRDCRKQTGVSSIKNREPESHGKKRSPDDVGHLKYKSRESREIAKEITRQMRSTLRSRSTQLSTSTSRGYAGDESSSSRSENDSATELEVMSLTSKNSAGSNSCYRPSSSRTTESSVSREARRRLSERWKMTHKSVDMGVINRGSTLGEMLAIPDRDARLAKLDVMSEKGSSRKLASNNEPAEWTEPLGISSRDGWKDGCAQNLSRSKSLPASSTAAFSTRTGMHREPMPEDKYMVSKEVMQSRRRRVITDSFTNRDGSPSRNSRSRHHSKGSHRSACTSSDDVDTPIKIDFGQNHMQNNAAEGNQFKQDHMVSGTSRATVPDSSSVNEDVTTADTTVPLKPAELLTSMLVEGESFTCNSNVPSSQEPPSDPSGKGLVSAQHSIADLESAASSKESDQPSPISVLETPFADDVSSGSECFESLSADLHGLRMQIQLLKLESEAYTEGQMLVSSDEDTEESCVPFSKEKGLGEEIVDYSYVVDVLHESGINYAESDTFIASWHSPECPVHPQVFEELEKKYTSQTSSTRSKRRLLFDRVNLALLTIYEQVASPYPWVRQPNRISSRWIKSKVEDRLFKVLADQKNKGNKDVADEVLAGELQWLDLGNDTDIIGREIERLLTEELLEELVAT